MSREDVGLRLLAAGESSGNVAVRQRFIDAACQRLAAGELYRRSIGVIGMRGQAVGRPDSDDAEQCTGEVSNPHDVLLLLVPVI